MNKGITLLLLVLTNVQVSGQLFNSILKEAQRKIEQRVADKIVDAVSDEIAKRAFRPIETSMDSMMRKSYQDSVNQGKDVDWKKAGKSYAEFLQGMNEAVDLPPSYTFDIRQDIEMTEYDGKKVNMVMFYSQKQPFYGIETRDKDNESSLIVMDLEKDAMVMYSTSKKGKKQTQTFANVSRFSKSMASAVTENQNATRDFNMQKTGKTKKVAGYTCEEFRVVSPKMEMLMYVTKDVPILWNERSSVYMGQFAPADYAFANQYQKNGGAMLEYTATQTEGKKETSTWTTTSIKKEAYSINNSEYTFGDKDKK